MKEKSEISKKIAEMDHFSVQLSNLQELISLQEEEFITEITQEMNLLTRDIAAYEVNVFFTSPQDEAGCFLEIHAGAGGTEAQDWALMLERMYVRYATSQFAVEIIDEVCGEEAGIKSCTLKISGKYAYAWLKHETGIHRLVRISPFNANAKRHTSFSAVFVYPDVAKDIIINIESKDLRIDTYRASGAGGQHVNKTDSAVRITHLPTMLVAQSQMDRSQHRNRDIAMQMLHAKLYDLEMRQKNAAETQARSAHKEIAWGNQIRSYVLHPYNMVKDLRTRFETANTTAILDGKLEEMLTFNLKQLNASI